MALLIVILVASIWLGCSVNIILLLLCPWACRSLLRWSPFPLFFGGRPLLRWSPFPRTLLPFSNVLFCIENDEFCITNDEFCIKMDIEPQRQPSISHGSASGATPTWPTLCLPHAYQHARPRGTCNQREIYQSPACTHKADSVCTYNTVGADPVKIIVIFKGRNITFRRRIVISEGRIIMLY